MIVYYDKMKEHAEHSGIVVSKLNIDVIRVWSKWGKGYEMIHPAVSASGVRFKPVL